jgi:hypothetical protein
VSTARLPLSLGLAASLLAAQARATPPALALPPPPPGTTQRPAAPATKPKLVVLELSAAGGVDAQVARALTEALTNEVSSRGFFAVMSSGDVQTLLGLERQRQMLGCVDEEGNCMVALAGALGARFVLSGSIARLGEVYQLTLQTLDSTQARPVGRSTRIAKDLATLRNQLAYAVAEATATPLPPPPSRLLSYSLMGAGALALAGGGMVGLQALNQQAAMRRELENGQQQPLALRTRASYAEELRSIGHQKTLSLVTLGAGAALVGAGVLLFPPDLAAAPARAVRVGLVPTGTGGALVGSF